MFGIMYAEYLFKLEADKIKLYQASGADVAGGATKPFLAHDDSSTATNERTTLVTTWGPGSEKNGV